MAFVGTIAARLFRSAVAVLRQASTAISERALTQRIIQINGQIAGQPFQAYQAIARQAQRSVNAAQQMASNPNTDFGATNLPVDPSLQPGDRRFNFRILVTVTDPHSLAETRYVVNATSNYPRSLQNIVADVSQHFAAYGAYQTQRTYLATIPQGAPVHVEILSAGRRA